MKSPLAFATQPCTVTCLESFAGNKLAENKSATAKHTCFMEVSSQLGMTGLLQRLASITPPDLLNVGFLVVQFLPLPDTLYPQFTNINPRIMYGGFGRELHSNFVNKKGT